MDGIDNRQTYIVKNKVKYYELLRKMWLSLKNFEKEYGEFQFSKDDLSKEQQYEELIDYYRKIMIKKGIRK